MTAMFTYWNFPQSKIFQNYKQKYFIYHKATMALKTEK